MHNRGFMTCSLPLASFSEITRDKIVKIKKSDIQSLVFPKLLSPAFCLPGKVLVIAICSTVNCELVWTNHDWFLRMRSIVE